MRHRGWARPACHAAIELLGAEEVDRPRVRRDPAAAADGHGAAIGRSPATTFQCAFWVFETGSQESILPAPDPPVETRVRVAPGGDRSALKMSMLESVSWLADVARGSRVGEVDDRSVLGHPVEESPVVVPGVRSTVSGLLPMCM